MVLSKPLPLRKLPMVVFRKVLSHLSPNELILLAQCSKITKSFVRAYYPKKLTMSMSFCHFEIQIFEECGKCYEYSATSPDPFRHPTVYCCYPTEESIKRTLELMDTFYDTLGAKLLLVKLYSLGEVDASIIIDRVHRNQPVLQRLKWKVLQVSESTKNSILGKLKCKELILEFSKWFKLSDLLSSTCDKFGLERSTWTGEDLNTFLKEWVKGRLPNLSFFWIDTNSLFDQESAKNGLELLDSNLFVQPDDWTLKWKFIRNVNGSFAAFHFNSDDGLFLSYFKFVELPCPRNTKTENLTSSDYFDRFRAENSLFLEPLS